MAAERISKRGLKTVMGRAGIKTITIILLLFTFVTPALFGSFLHDNNIYQFHRDLLRMLAYVFNFIAFLMFALAVFWLIRWRYRRGSDQDDEFRIIISGWLEYMKERNSKRWIGWKNLFAISAGLLFVSVFITYYIALAVSTVALFYIAYETYKTGFGLWKQVSRKRIKRLYPDFYHSDAGQRLEDKLPFPFHHRLYNGIFRYSVDSSIPSGPARIYKFANSVFYMVAAATLAVWMQLAIISYVVLVSMCFQLQEVGLWSGCHDFHCRNKYQKGGPKFCFDLLKKKENQGNGGAGHQGSAAPHQSGSEKSMK